MWGFIIALVSGALMSIQGVFNTEVTKQTSIWVSSGWVQFSAFIACVIMWFFTGRNEVGGLFQVEPKYMLAGGIMGALITYTVIKSVGTLGPAKSALLIVVAQIIVAYAIEVMEMCIRDSLPDSCQSVLSGWQGLASQCLCLHFANRGKEWS